MDFRAALEVMAGGLSSDEAMDPSSTIGNDVDTPASGRTVQPDPRDDGQDPATPGGPAPYNASDPLGEPVVSDPMWEDPQQPAGKGAPMPFTPGPNLDTNTIHNARRASYEHKHNRERDDS